MALNITPVENHRGRETGVLVYPVYSRRSKGLSVGINLYPDKKQCLFNCPYCEVFPFATNAVFSLEQMENDLHCAIAAAQEQNIPIKDICFSGNGEPSLSHHFPEALRIAASVRDKAAPSAALVLITNGTGLLQPQIFSLLKDAASGSIELDIWLKLDAGTPEWYKKMNRSNIQFDELTNKIKELAVCAPVTIQTMLCMIKGSSPPPDEKQAWEQLTLELAKSKKVRKVQIYGKARSAPEDPFASALPASYLEERADSLRGVFSEKGITAPVEIYL